MLLMISRLTAWRRSAWARQLAIETVHAHAHQERFESLEAEHARLQAHAKEVEGARDAILGTLGKAREDLGAVRAELAAMETRAASAEDELSALKVTLAAVEAGMANYLICDVIYTAWHAYIHTEPEQPRDKVYEEKVPPQDAARASECLSA
jgi:septal ring factor EnvC (AmiA/AmiB activator)